MQAHWQRAMSEKRKSKNGLRQASAMVVSSAGIMSCQVQPCHTGPMIIIIMMNTRFSISAERLSVLIT